MLVGGRLSDRKGINLPGVMLPISPLTEKDLVDLRFALELGCEWIALSFVQCPEDVVEARRLIGNRAHVLVKVEKPSALDRIDEIVAAADAREVKILMRLPDLRCRRRSWKRVNF